jgi:hypothetical protein
MTNESDKKCLSEAKGISFLGAAFSLRRPWEPNQSPAKIDTHMNLSLCAQVELVSNPSHFDRLKVEVRSVSSSFTFQ